MLRKFTLDDNDLVLKASAAVTASAAGSVIADLGDGLVEGNMVIDVTAIDIVGNDEIYDIILQLSPDAAFGTAGNIVERCSLNLSAKETKRSDCDKDDVIGRYILPFSNEHGGTIYRYARIYTVEAGATSSITYSARLAKKAG
jgi:hypothetical protein